MKELFSIESGERIKNIMDIVLQKLFLEEEARSLRDQISQCSVDELKSFYKKYDENSKKRSNLHEQYVNKYFKYYCN